MASRQITDKATGLTFDTSTPESTVEALLEIQSYQKSFEQTIKRIKKQLADHNGLEHNNYIVRVMNVQRQNYNKGLLRNYLDEDTMDLFLEVRKGALDSWLKEQVANGTEYDTHAIRSALEPVGEPYEVIKLEKLTRD